MLKLREELLAVEEDRIAEELAVRLKNWTLILMK